MSQDANVPHESIIRDKLAENLEVIEPGLRLRTKELVVANPHGAGGKIDIFAEDRWAHRVVIEIKRSDKSAREATHEIFKYSELLKRQHGLKDSELRILVLSTDWHELLVPFSAYARDTAFQCEGYRITVDDHGAIQRLVRVELLERPQLLDFIPHHVLWLFESPALRAAAVPTLAGEIRKQGITDFVLFLLDYHDRAVEHALTSRLLFYP